ncbi:MAG: hypothetical protein ACK44A_12595 [Roseateles sp.]
MRRARNLMNTMMLSLALHAHAAVERVDPPHWWVGMQEPTL